MLSTWYYALCYNVYFVLLLMDTNDVYYIDITIYIMLHWEYQFILGNSPSHSLESYIYIVFFFYNIKDVCQ